MPRLATTSATKIPEGEGTRAAAATNRRAAARLPGVLSTAVREVDYRVHAAAASAVPRELRRKGLRACWRRLARGVPRRLTTSTRGAAPRMRPEIPVTPNDVFPSNRTVAVTSSPAASAQPTAVTETRQHRAEAATDVAPAIALAACTPSALASARARALVPRPKPGASPSTIL